MTKQKNKIFGSYGPEEDDFTDGFEIKLEEVKPPTPVTPVTPIKPSVTIVTNFVKNNHLGEGYSGIYTGEMSNGMFNGKGTFVSDKYGTYTGDFKDDK